MSNVQQAELIEFVVPSTLKPHPLNTTIYGEDGYQDLIESIKDLGVLQALYVTSKNIILSGHRRWRAAMAAGCPTVPVIRMNYTNELDEHQAIIEHNRYRIKNGLQLYNEGKELERIESYKAKQRQKMTHLVDRGFQRKDMVAEIFPPPSEQGETRNIVAKTIGLGSGRQWDKLDYVHTHKPDLLPQIKPDGISLSRAYNQARSEITKAQSASTPLPEGIFNIIYADPPWQYSNAIQKWGSTDLHYKTMSIDELCNYRDSTATRIQEKFATNAALFIWVTNPFLRDAFQILDAWGFEYKTNIVWIKTGLQKPGSGFWVRGRHELLFICSRGSFIPNQKGQEPIGSVLEAPIQGHSKKPEAIYDLIERMYPNGKYLELFARNTREKWTSWGNEITEQK